MPKLKSITFIHTPKAPGLRAGDLSTVDLENPHGALLGWRALIRGPMLFLVSPPGWTQTNQMRNADPSGPRRTVQSPISNCFFMWDGDEADVSKAVAVYTSDPFGPPPEAVLVDKSGGSLLDQLPVDQKGDA
jgi:hypothetical protein